jgi:beta-fructofuranosidase
VVLSLKDKWIWDFWLVSDKDSDDGLWHIYFLQADNTLPHPDDRHRNVSQGHATSRNLVTWDHLGTCFAPSASPGFDDWTTWTGSVVKDDNGLWHLFYTGSTRGDGGFYQRIGHATSKDMHSWVRVGSGLCLDKIGPNSEFYEEYTPGHWHDRAMRDPWVMRNPDGEGWIMYFTARAPGRAEPNAGGAVGFATSPDLATWTLQKPVYTGGAFGQLEVPQVFEYGGRWYMAFCTAHFHWSNDYLAKNPEAPVMGTSYLTAPTHLGPWEPAVPFLDGSVPCQRYAGKIIERDGKLSLIAFLHDRPDGSFVGTVGDPIPLKVHNNGTLSLEDSHG